MSKFTRIKWNQLSRISNTLARQDTKDALNQVVDELNDPSRFVLTKTAASELTAEDSGSTIYLNSATGFATTLPAPAPGLKFKFIVKTAPTSGNHTIVTKGSANIIQGNSFVSATAGTGVPAVNEDSINLIANQAAVGDNVDLWSDGTNWYVNAFAALGAGVTFTSA
jgi:hypothetical protein